MLWKKKVQSCMNVIAQSLTKQSQSTMMNSNIGVGVHHRT